MTFFGHLNVSESALCHFLVDSLRASCCKETLYMHGIFIAILERADKETEALRGKVACFSQINV